MKHILTLCLLALAATFAAAQDAPRYFSLGADISGTTELEHRGVRHMNAAGDTIETTQLMHDLGLDGIRLRVWVDPKERWSSPTDVLVMALRAQQLGMDLMIDFHYSDWWADPGKQHIPAAWADLTFDQQKQAMADHTRQTLQLLKDYGVEVRWVQVGNETTNGMMWPVANVPEHMQQYAELTQAGYDAVKEVYPEAEVIVHLDNGYDPYIYNRMFDGLQQYGAKWDIIGMSIYPYWTMQSHPEYTEQRLIDETVDNIKALTAKYGTDCMIVETGVEAKNPEPGRDFITALIDAMLTRTDGHCLGVYYWEPGIDATAAYPLGAFANGKPTVIMDAFTQAAEKLKK